MTSFFLAVEAADHGKHQLKWRRTSRIAFTFLLRTASLLQAPTATVLCPRSASWSTTRVRPVTTAWRRPSERPSSRVRPAPSTTWRASPVWPAVSPVCPAPTVRTQDSRSRRDCAWLGTADISYRQSEPSLMVVLLCWDGSPSVLRW